MDWLRTAWYAIFYRLCRFWEYLQTIWRYYGYRSFRNTDLALVVNYFGANPYYIARRFAELQGEKDLYTYGETPLLTLEEISRRCGIIPTDTVYELGCGRGRTCFWLSTVFGSQKVIGIDNNPYFISMAQRIVKKFDIQNLEFRCEDMLHADLSEATVVYLYGSAFDTDFIERLAAKLGRLPKGTKIISISYPLYDYSHQPLFELVDTFEVSFTWGRANVYFQRVTLS